MRTAFSGGGTLGSVTPLLAAAQAIRHSDPAAEFLWIGTDGGVEEGPVRKAGIDFRAISAGKLRRYLSLSNLSDLYRIAAGFFEARRLLAGWRPDVLVSAGGFVAVPAVWAARSLGIRVHVHQMDFRPGLANRLSAPFASSVSVSFEKSLADYARYRPVWTGNPVRSEILAGDRTAAIRHFGLESERPTVLFLGGGTGAAVLNRLAVGAAPFLADIANVIHVTGPGKALPDGSPSGAALRFEALDVSGMSLAYAAADLVVTRAGMGTLTELAALGRAAALVPMPDSHQEENAEAFRSAGAAVVWPEGALTPASLAKSVQALLDDGGRRAELGQGMAAMGRPDAAERLAGIVLGGVGR